MMCKQAAYYQTTQALVVCDLHSCLLPVIYSTQTVIIIISITSMSEKKKTDFFFLLLLFYHAIPSLTICC